MCAQKALSRNVVLCARLYRKITLYSSLITRFFVVYKKGRLSPFFLQRPLFIIRVRVNTHTHHIFGVLLYIYYVSYGLVSAQFRREAARRRVRLLD